MLLKSHPLIDVLPGEKTQPNGDNEYVLFSTNGKGILAGMQLGLSLQRYRDQLIGVSVVDQALRPDVEHWISFREAIPSLGSDMYVLGNDLNGRLFQFRGTPLTLEVDLDGQLQRLRSGFDIPIFSIDIGDYNTDNNGTEWCGIKDCQYDFPSHFKN